MNALDAIRRGFSVLPTGLNKKPLLETWKEFQDTPASEEQVKRWQAQKPAGWAVVTGRVSGVIVHDFDGETGIKIMRSFGLDPHVRTGGGGFHCYFKHPGWHVPTLNSKQSGELSENWFGVDVRGDGGYAVFDGRSKDGPYVWLREPDQLYEVDVLPPEFRKAYRIYPATNGNGNHGANGTGAKYRRPAHGDTRVSIDILLERAVEAIPANGRNNAGFGLAMQLRDNSYSQGEAEAAMRTFVARCPPINTKGQREPYTETDARKSIESAYSRPARDPWEPKQPPTPPPPRRPTPGKPDQPPDDEEPPPAAAKPTGTPDLLAYGFEDHGNAQRLIALYGDRMRYCYDFKRWLVFDGKRWAVDKSNRARALATETSMEFLRQAVKAGNGEATKFAKQSLDGKRTREMLWMAEPELAISALELDTHHDLLNFTNCTVNLKTREQLPHDQEHYITKLIHYKYNPDAQCPLYKQFLFRIMGAHPDASEAELDLAQALVDYQQRAKGYSLTGWTREKGFFFSYGPNGNNGKTTDLSLQRRLMREYSTIIQASTLMVRIGQESGNVQSDLSDLEGARFVMTSETEEGQKISEARMKLLSQGQGELKAIAKYENGRSFAETWKIWVDCNHKPKITGTDDAIWGRVGLIPYTNSIPTAEIDKELPAKLMKEAEGILAWMVEGAFRWYAEGLTAPVEMETAKQEYREESDQVGRFVEECCVKHHAVETKGAVMYSSFKTWADSLGEKPISETAFAIRMKKMGFVKGEGRKRRHYQGIGLLSPDQPE